jgi:dolichol-phosphate mannosyltransferase
MIDQPQARSTLSVVVPCYDEAAVIRELHRRVTTVCRSLLGDSYELVGHRRVSRQDPRNITNARPLRRPRGRRRSLPQPRSPAELSLARADRILVIDLDLQDPPELLPHMMQLMDGADVRLWPGTWA